MRLKHINIRRWLLVSLVLPALMASGQSPGDTIPEPRNQLRIDLQFLGRGESRYGGLPSVVSEETEEGEILDDGKVPSSNFVLSRTRLPINFKRDWLEARVTPQHSGVWGQAGKGSFNRQERRKVRLWIQPRHRVGEEHRRGKAQSAKVVSRGAHGDNVQHGIRR